ncbi:FMN-binding negative transcriptional regulator [Actinoplanes sp. N902-109]|uniref:FMN-binding negative transcriptional regulator n=1 Tax=Actinoplanes sp. (strain N902-109) TaxID=649831 RepID=UPI0003294F74|nr:FMN-binding negative transcriptional regulator [Actinoplanes sp. N902-109]AGL15732.1 FMN-binding negative transcriptional regulator [Actinoplanes sp. N902-109]
MYIPKHFAPTDATVRELLTGARTADLITSTADGLLATYLPVLYDSEHHALLAHVARNNDQWRRPPVGEAMAIVRGPDAYVSPSWYATKAEHGRVVPTWNYTTAHVYGTLVVHDDPGWLEAIVRRLTGSHESGRDHAWSVDDAPPDYIAGQLRAIVGVELRITRVEAKVKMSQNRPPADIDGVIAGYAAAGNDSMTEAMRQARPS